jgi:hypothetical protein
MLREHWGRTCCTTVWMALAVGVALAAGCGGGGGGGAPPVGPDLRGQWAGVITQPGSPATSLTATIGQDGNAVTIHTSLQGIGAAFTGASTDDGCLSLTDGFDGETWTTFRRKTTPTRIQISDFTRAPVLGEPQPALRTIDMQRTL